jgi:hypothetical protein
MLDISRLISVQTQITQGGAQGRLFNQALAIGDSNVINGLQRVRNYSSLAEVAADFGTTAPEYLAASIYFQQKPTPTSFACGRWLRTATAAILEGAILSPVEQAISLFNQITNGGFDVTVDGTAKTLTALNFSQAANLNAVAAIIQTAFSGAATCIWNGFEFVITSATTGAGVEATGTMSLSGQPSANDTFTVNGTTVTFVSSSPSSDEVLIGASTQQTAANLWAFLVNSTDTNIIKATYSLSADVVTATYYEVGTGGNSFTLAKSGSNLAVSASTLAGGVNASSVSYATSPTSSYQDVSSLLGLTAALALPLVPGYAAESALAAVVACDSVSQNWYGMGFAASVMPSDSDALAIAAFIEADPVTRMFGWTTEETGVLTTQVSNDIASEMMALNYEQSFVMYSSTNPYAAFAIFGNLLTTNLSGSNTFKTMMYLQAIGIVAENLDDPEADALEAKRCNVFTSYDNSTSILQYGTMAGPVFIDETYGTDAFANGIQTAFYNVLYTAGTKVPQTDQGDQQFAVAMSQVCQQYVTNGFLAPGQWNAQGFGQLQEGQYLKLGYYIYMEPIAQQSEADRAARKAPPFQIAAKLAGANQTGQVLITINQ